MLANINDASTNPTPPILEPGRFDGGDKNPPIARLTAFHPLLFGTGVNEVDAAIAELLIPSDMTADIVGIGSVSPAPILPVVDVDVQKHGAGTQLREGKVDDIAADIKLPMPPHGKAFFHRQIAVRNTTELFAGIGDSGSLVVEKNSRRPVGLLFAIANGFTYCNYIDKVLTQLGLTIL